MDDTGNEPSSRVSEPVGNATRKHQIANAIMVGARALQGVYYLVRLVGLL